MAKHGKHKGARSDNMMKRMKKMPMHESMMPKRKRHK